MKDLKQMDKKEVAWWLAEQVVLLFTQVGAFYAVRAVFDKVNPPTQKDSE